MKTNTGSRALPLAVMLLLAIAALSNAASTGHGDTLSASGINAANTAHYEITIPADGHRSAIVTATLVPDGADFYMFPGAQQLPQRWATFVTDFEVRDRDGQAIPATNLDDGTWRLDAAPAGPVTFSYRVDLDHEQHAWSGGIDGAAYWREYGAFYTARALFIVNGEDREGITVAFRLPPEWQVTTPWPVDNDQADTFVVADHDLLATSMLFAGTHSEVPVGHGPFEFLLALGGDAVLAQEDMFVDMSRGVLDYYVDLMGDVPRLVPGDKAGRPVVIMTEADAADGEALGNNISILVVPSANGMAQHVTRLIFAHEFFHLWNGKSFTPDGEDGEWFKEGFSNYYTLKALHRIGYLTDESFLGLLAGFFYQRYAGDDAVGREPMTRGDLKHDHWGLIYSGGMMVAIAQDLQIRATTDNEKSLDDLMRHMFDEYSGDTFGIDEVERMLGDLNGASQEKFFDRYVRGTERLDISGFLLLAGIDTIEEEGRTVFRIADDQDPAKGEMRRGFFGE